MLLEKKRAEGRRITLTEIARTTRISTMGIDRYVLGNLAAPDRGIVTNTAHLDARMRYFGCPADDIVVLVPPPSEKVSCHIDDLYPRPTSDQES